MFWDNVWNSDNDFSGSGLSNLLNGEDVTLEAVLANDRVLDEAAAGDRTLGCYLEQSSQLDGLISYIIQEPPGAEDAESEEKKRHGFVASELLACPALALTEALFEHQEILDAFFSVLLRPPPLDPGNTAYFRKVFEVLLRSNFFALGDFLKGRGLIRRMVLHMGTYSIAELLRILCYDDSRMSSMDNEWLVAEGVMPALVEALADPERQENANQILIELAMKCPGTDLVNQVSAGPLLEQLVGMLTSAIPNVVASTLPLVTVIIQQNMKLEEPDPPPYRRPMNLPRGWSVDQPEEPEAKETGVPEIITSLLPVLDGLAKLLTIPPAPSVMQCGVHANLGSLRLRVSHFFLALVQSGYAVVDDALASLSSVKLLPVLFDLFFLHDWHNLFHSAAERIFNGVLLSKHVGLLSSLFIDGRFLQKAYAALDHAQTVQGKRAGNLGHILRILNAFSSWDDQYLVLSLIGQEEAAQWVEFRDGLLNEENWRASPVDDLPSEPPPPTPDEVYGVPPPESYIAGLTLNHDFGDSDDEPEGDPPRPGGALGYNQGYGDSLGFDSDDDDEDDGLAASNPGSSSEGIPCLGCGRMWEVNENFCASCGRKRTLDERIRQESSEVSQETQSTQVSQGVALADQAPNAMTGQELASSVSFQTEALNVSTTAAQSSSEESTTRVIDML